MRGDSNSHEFKINVESMNFNKELRKVKIFNIIFVLDFKPLKIDRLYDNYNCEFTFGAFFSIYYQNN